MSSASLYAYVALAKVYLAALAPYVAAIALLMAIILVLLHFLLRRRLARLALGTSGSLEESIAILTREMEEARNFRAELERYLKLAESRLRGSVQGIGVVRFNPFSGDGSGGNQSFAAAFLDEHGDGVVFSTLYARDRVGVYGKPLEAGISHFELSEEERLAIDKAQKQIAKNRKP